MFFYWTVWCKMEADWGLSNKVEREREKERERERESNIIQEERNYRQWQMSEKMYDYILRYYRNTRRENENLINFLFDSATEF